MTLCVWFVYIYISVYVSACPVCACGVTNNGYLECLTHIDPKRLHIL